MTNVTPFTRPPAGTQKDYDIMADDMDRRLRGDMGSGHVFNGSTKFVNTMLSILSALMVAGIIGGVVLYGNVQAISVKVDLIISGHIK
jgi:hypothetical protein